MFPPVHIAALAHEPRYTTEKQPTILGNRIEKSKVLLSPSESDVGQELDVYHDLVCRACELDGDRYSDDPEIPDDGSDVVYIDYDDEEIDEMTRSARAAFTKTILSRRQPFMRFYKCRDDGCEGYYLCERCKEDGVHGDTGHHVARLKRLGTWHGGRRYINNGWLDTTSLSQ